MVAFKVTGSPRSHRCGAPNQLRDSVLKTLEDYWCECCVDDCDRGLYPSHPGAVLAAEMDTTKAQQGCSLSWENLLRFR